MAPIRLTDEQLDAVFRAAQPLPVADRDAFLCAVAAGLQGLARGDGAVGRGAEGRQRGRPSPAMSKIRAGGNTST
jgi:hypothetical protein